EPDVQLLLVVLGTDVNRRPDLGHGAQPVLAGDVGNVLGQLDDGLASTALAREQAGLPKRHAIQDRPLALRHGLQWDMSIQRSGGSGAAVAAVVAVAAGGGVDGVNNGASKQTSASLAALPVSASSQSLTSPFSG